MRKCLLAAVITCVAVDSVSAEPSRWFRYQLGSAAVDLPIDVFPTDAGPTKHRLGRVHRSSDGRAALTVYSLPNQPRRSPAAFLKKTFQLPPSAALYRHVTRNILAVSGYRGDQIWYARCNFGSRRLNCIGLNYPANEKEHWDATVTRISNTLSYPG